MALRSRPYVILEMECCRDKPDICVNDILDETLLLKYKIVAICINAHIEKLWHRNFHCRLVNPYCKLCLVNTQY